MPEIKNNQNFITSRTIIILSIFIAVSMVASVFIYLYHSQADLLVNQYIAKITICGNIASEEDCYAKDFCEGIYKPTSSESNELSFIRCQKVKAQVLVELEKEKKLCQESGGEWYRNKLGNFCLCQNTQKFNKTQGCISK